MKNAEVIGKNFIGRPLKIHLIGVAGSGMSGIAGLLLSLGHRVSGCDRVRTPETERLERIGMIFHPQNGAGEYVSEQDMVIYSSAIKAGNGAFEAARQAEIPMVRRAEALAGILSIMRGIIVAGTHGKTTTSAMAAHVLRAGGLHPSHYVGAEIPILGTNANWDPLGEYFVAEGDESDGTLVHYRPEHTILLNIEREHLDHYGSMEKIEDAFRTLIENTTGSVFYCADDPVARRLCEELANGVSFGREDGDYTCRNLERLDFATAFEVHAQDGVLGRAVLNIPGEHNVSNALGVIALATELDIDFETIAGALAGFRGARRRFEEKYRSHDFLVVDDYGHHPTEIEATLKTAQQIAPGRVIAIFQPHRYSRTQSLRREFGPAFKNCDLLWVTDVYAASEQPIPGITGRTIVDEVMKHQDPATVHYQPALDQLRVEVAHEVEPGDLLITLGAGNVHQASTELATDLKRLTELRQMMTQGKIALYEPLSRHTTLRVGGPADVYAEPETEEDFARLVRYCKKMEIPLMVMGRGSNLLVRDGGVRGVVVHLGRGDFSKLEIEDGRIRAGAGVKLKQLATAAQKAGIGGFEWMEGIPGNVGGALRMNAGAMGGETFGQVVELRLLDAEGEFQNVTPGELEVHYRNVPSLRESYAVSALFSGKESPRDEIDRLLEESMAKRKETQPIAACAGCIFKNPNGAAAGQLIEELGLKDFAVGQARVSEIHGNFIVNDGGASSRDILDLIFHIQNRAKEERGIELDTEVEIVGEEIEAS